MTDLPRASPPDEGTRSRPAEAVGRARRIDHEDGSQLWRWDDPEDPAIARLLAWGPAGIGGFARGGLDDEGAWLWRAPAPTRLDAWLRGDARPWSQVLPVLRALVQRLVWCEHQGLFPGPLWPREVGLDGAPDSDADHDAEASAIAIVLRAEPLIRGVVGATTSAATGSPGLSRWVPPEQARGEPWDNAANRYCVGLVLYRALAGHHPFSGKGLRRGLEDQAQQGAAPFPDAIAQALPPGVQSLCLQLLDPDRAARPDGAKALLRRIDALAGPSATQAGDLAHAHTELATPSRATDRPRDATPRAPRAGSQPAPPHSAMQAIVEHRAAVRARGRSKESGARATPPATSRPDARGSSSVAPSDAEPFAVRRRTVGPPARSVIRSHVDAMTWASWWRRLLLGIPFVAGLALAAVLVRGVEPPPSPRPPSIGAQAPLTLEQTDPDDCATCHPRQVAQWTQSVMAHSVKSPLFQALEMLIEEQVGRDFDCPEGAGILRRADPRTACRDRDTGLPITGSGGELWCVNCHAAGENLRAGLPAWDGRAGRSGSRQPLRDLLPASTMEGIGCAVCHTATGPVRPGNEASGRYEGNPTWISFLTGQRFSSRPEDARGQPGIANSGYLLDPAVLLEGIGFGGPTVPGGVHRRPEASTHDYLRSSEFCGACHDVRLFGTDVIGVRDRGEHFKRLRNAYSEWSDWADDERRAGRAPASCQDCHMSEYPGVCVPDSEGLASTFVDPTATALARGCPPGTRFEPREPGQYPTDRAAIGAGTPHAVTTHYFSGVDAPLTATLSPTLLDDPTLDESGMPRGLRPRRDLLLGRTFRFEVDGATRRGGRLEVPVVIENVGAGHRVPAGFSQEREIWVHLKVTDRDGRIVYEVGRVDADDENLHDKEFVRINVDDRFVDEQGRPLGVFGADVADGPDVPQWSPAPRPGVTRFRGRGLVNLQNGFLRCVQCIGFIDAAGRCQPRPGQGRFRADRYDDGGYDLDTGECISNLVGEEALLETYFPVGALDSTRGLTKGPDAIIDVRSAPPNVPLRYTYELPGSAPGPLTVEARLMFRAFPPFLVQAFADYEALQAARGRRPSGPLVTHDMLDRLEVVELHRVRVEVP